MFSLFRRIRARLKYRNFERDLAQEIDVHRAMKQEEIEAAGISGAEAHSRAARALGNVTYMREQARLIRLGAVGRMVDHLQADLRDAARSLRRNPAFTGVTIGVLALGIGLNAAIFSVVQSVFLPPAQAASPATLVYVSSDRAIRLRDFQAGTREAFRALATHGPVEDVVVAGGRAARRAGEQVTANYFDVIGVPPVIGRAFHPNEDDGANPARAVVISHQMWTQTLGSNPDALGSDVQIGDRSFRIVGIAPEGFNGLSAPWEPSVYWVTRAQYFGNPDPEIARTAAEPGRHLVARLQPGVSVDQARAIAAAYGSASAPDSRSQLLRVESSENILLPFSDGKEKWLRALASTVMGIGLLVLLIAGTNIAGVMSARGVTQRREFAVRQALGAGGWRLVQQRLAESLLLATVGGIAGFGLAAIFVRVYRAASPAEFALDAPLDAGVLTFTTIVCLGTGFLLGLAPALQARRPDLLKILGGGVGAGIPRHERRRLQIGVLVPQILFAVVLMVVGSAYASTLLRMEFPEKGYRSENVVAATVGYVDVVGPSQRPAPTANAADDLRARRRRFDGDLLVRLRQTPGITAAALVSRLPSDHMGTVNNRWVSDDGGVSAEGVTAEGSWVSSGYFDTFEVPLIRGRDFDDTDSFGSPAVAIISESLAKRLWPNGDALGRSFGHVGATRGTGGSGWYQWKQVVGIAADTRSPLQSEPHHRPYLYTPLTQVDTGWGQVFAVAAGPAGVMSALRNVIEADPLAQVLRIETIDQTIDREMYPLRAAAWLLGVSGASGLLLAALGLYGVVTHSVAQQTREFGIRATLGASSGALVRHVLLSGARVAAFAAVPGAVLGLVGLRVATHFATMAPTVDPIAIAAVLTFIASVVMVACYIPARRAGRINPVTALRAD